MQNNRQSDHSGERIVHMFLTQYFYPLLGIFTEPDISQQIDGIDAICKLSGLGIYDEITIDEKCQLTRLNQTITNSTTQCFEIMSKYRNAEESYGPGWFSKDNSTQYYLFTYITKCKTTNQNSLTIDSIDEMEAIFISKDKVKQLLRSNGITMRNLKDFALFMINQGVHTRYTNNKYYYDFWKNNRDMYLCYSKNNLGEAPVNCIIKWNTLKSVAEYVFSINKKQIRILSKEGVTANA